MSIDVRTPIEKARDEKHRNICNDYLSLSEKVKDVKPGRIMRIVAERYCTTQQGVCDILVKHNLYARTPKTRK